MLGGNSCLLTYGTETLKAENLQSLERMEQMMVRWMCWVKDRKHSMDLYSLLGVQSVADVVRSGRLRWHLERRMGVVSILVKRYKVVFDWSGFMTLVIGDIKRRKRSVSRTES